MEPQHGRQVHRRQHVAVEDDDRLAEPVAGGKLDRAARAERRGLDDVAEMDAEIRPVAEHLFDPPRLVVEAEHDFVDFRHLTKQVDLVPEKRAIENRHDRLGRVQRERPQPRPLATGQEDGFHVSRRS